jgi:Aerotolerance regulator N-terminal/von Willebrand factor type A domain
MSFLYPLFLIGAAAIAIPIALHLFRRRTETIVDFPAVRLLHKAPVEQQRRRRLRELILLVLRVSALILLAVAFARPYFDRSTAAAPAPTTVIALDTSLSLSAPGQFDAARAAARRAAENAPATHTVAFVTFADTATLIVPATTDRGGVLAAIDKVTVTAGGTRYRTALARAAEAVTGGEGRIIIVTDLQQAGWEAADEGAVPDGISVEVVEIAPPLSNVAVTAARRDGQSMVVAIHNFGQRQVRVPVRLRLGERDVVTQPVDVAAQSAAEVRLTTTLPAKGAAEVRIDDADGYQSDNFRYVVLDPVGAVPIFVITADPPGSSNAGLYLERALSVADEGRAFTVTALDGRAFSALSQEQFGTPGALIVLGTSTLDRKGREMVAAFLRDGGRVLLTLGPDIDLATLSDTVGTHVDVDPQITQTTSRTVTLIATDGRHPIFRPFSSPTGALGDVYMEQYRRLNDQSGRTVLARFSGAGSALTEQSVERGRLLLFASDLDNRWNRFPLNPAFVPWAIETARYLTAGREQRQSYTLPDVPVGVSPTPGVHDLTTRAGVRIAVNPDVRESNPTHMSVEEFMAAITRLNQVTAVRAQAKASEAEERQRLWQIGLIVMFIALAGEGLIGRKAT